MFTYITIPAEMPADMLAYAGTLFTDLTLLIILAVGIPLGFYIIRKIVSLVKAR